MACKSTATIFTSSLSPSGLCNTALKYLSPAKDMTDLTPQLLGQNLTPAARRSTQVHHSLHSGENIELIIYLQKFESRASSPAFFLGQAVVDITLVLGGSSHFDAFKQSEIYKILQ